MRVRIFLLRGCGSVGQRKLFPATRSVVRVDGTSVAGTTYSDKESFSMYKSRMELRQTHKRLRAGLIAWEQVPKRTQELLIRYYGYTNEGVQL
jgi:hypothetical protein